MSSEAEQMSSTQSVYACLVLMNGSGGLRSGSSRIYYCCDGSGFIFVWLIRRKGWAGFNGMYLLGMARCLVLPG